MSVEHQAVVHLRLRGEYIKAEAELATLSAELRKTGEDLIELGNKLIQHPETASLDGGSLNSVISRLPYLLGRYENLLIEKEEKKAELEKFGEPFPPA
jgi:hypothetical protein